MTDTDQLKNVQNKATHDSTESILRAFYAFAIVLVAGVIGWFVFASTVQSDSSYPFKLGLDLAGGSHLVYEADVSEIAPEEVDELMGVLRDVIERRVNIFGVSEPLVQVEASSFVSGESRQRLVVELPGVTDIGEAVAQIGATPLLEFKLVNQTALTEQQVLDQLDLIISSSSEATTTDEVAIETASMEDQIYLDTGLTGRYLETAQLEFMSQQAGAGIPNEPVVSIRFNGEGADLFEQLTRDNVGGNLAIFLDGELLSAPRINESISGGSAIISGGFQAEEARDLAENLSFGALPVPIELQSTQTIGASLGAEILEKGVIAGLVGLSLVIIFMVLWYRLPGLVAVVALLSYVAVMLALFKVIPVTITAAGLAGFILSIGMAVDANVLVFERMKEEYRNGRTSREAAQIGFARAWSAIRDGNITSLLSAIILFWFGTSIVKGFALVFGIGVILSMLTALVVTRTLLTALPEVENSKNSLLAKLYRSGF